jgi:hypothetical protein
MSKIIMNNVTVHAKSGGSIKNCDVEMTNTQLNFTEDNIDISTDESVAIVQSIVESGYQSDLVKLVSLLKSTPEAEQEQVVKASALSKFLTGVKDFKPMIELLLKAGAN